MVRCITEYQRMARLIYRGSYTICKKTGDYSVLSHADLSVLALTYDFNTAKLEAEQIASEQVRSCFFW